MAESTCMVVERYLTCYNKSLFGGEIRDLRILIVHNQYQIPGGEDTCAINEGEFLRAHGHRVWRYTRHNDELKSRGVIGRGLLFFETFYSWKTYLDVKRIVRENHIEIVHVHNTLPLISCSVYYAAKKAGAKTVQTLHNFRLLCPGATLVRNGTICKECLSKGLMHSVKYGCYKQSKLQTFVSAAAMKFHRCLHTYDKVDAYIALTEFNKELFSDLLPIEKIYIKPSYSVDLSAYQSETPENYFVFIARLEELKGIQLVLDVFHDLKDVKLKIIGIGPYEVTAKQYVRENQMDNVEFMGFLSREEMLTTLGKAYAFIFPTQWYEGFPKILVESYSVGVPVIAGDIGNVGVKVKQGETGLKFEYNSSQALRQAILKFVNHEVDRNRMALAAREEYELYYTEEQNYNDTIRIYQEVLNK